MARIRVRLKTARVQLSFDGSEKVFTAQVEPLLLCVAGGGTRRAAVPAAPPPVPEPAPVITGYRPPSAPFSTFQRQMGPDVNGGGERIAAYGFFLWNYEKKEVFEEDELRGCYAADERQPPPDLHSVCEALAARRILASSGDRAWRLTPKGLSRARKAFA